MCVGLENIVQMGWWTFIETRFKFGSGEDKGTLVWGKLKAVEHGDQKTVGMAEYSRNNVMASV